MDGSVPPLNDLPTIDPVDAIVRFLSDGHDEVIRCAAARALGAIGSRRAAPPLVHALLDEDPDVRTDAMTALVRCAQDEDAEAILRSLEGDPVKEVKTTAIEALTVLKNKGAISLLCRLAVDRAVDQVTWEDEIGLWDDWLEVQNAAIEALGQLGASEAVPTLLEARADEFGQDIDQLVFSAFAKMPEAGLSTLIDIIRDHEGRLRERALKALGSARHDLLEAFAPHLVEDADPTVRSLAIPCFAADSPEANRLAILDPDRDVRIAAVAAFATANADLAHEALRDPDETVRAVALETMVLPDDAALQGDLAANAAAWMQMGGSRLAAACAARLPVLDPETASEVLQILASDGDRPIEARLAAIRHLPRLANEVVITALAALVEDPVQQVRAAALAAFAELAREPDGPWAEQSVTALCDAIRSALSAPKAIEPDDLGARGLAGASKIEDAPQRLRISRDGEIIEADEQQTAAIEDDEEAEADVIAFPTSTLAAIEARIAEPEPPAEDDTAENTPKLSPRKRRVAVDGPGDYRADLPITAMRVSAACPDKAIEEAIADTLDAANPDIRSAAFEGLSNRATHVALSAETVEKLRNGVSDNDPRIRYFAVSALAHALDDSAEALEPMLDDEDAAIRAVAVRAVASSNPGAVLGHIGDPSPIVRRAALYACLANDMDSKEGLTLCCEAQAIDTLREAMSLSPAWFDAALRYLELSETKRRDRLVILEALAQTAFENGASHT